MFRMWGSGYVFYFRKRTAESFKQTISLSAKPSLFATVKAVPAAATEAVR